MDGRGTVRRRGRRETRSQGLCVDVLATRPGLRACDDVPLPSTGEAPVWAEGHARQLRAAAGRAGRRSPLLRARSRRFGMRGDEDRTSAALSVAVRVYF